MVGIQRLLIANRGEIAVRIIHACRESGVSPVVVVGPGDEGAMHAVLADASVTVSSYLDGRELVAAARELSADAVHPGYGFLSERAEFAELVLDAGMRWIGPPPAAMRRLGDKVEARALAEAAGVPTVPGYAGPDLSDAALEREAARLGLPLMIKAAAGGGGRGMRVVDDLSHLREALADARSESASAFGDDRVFLERRLVDVRHIEIQVLIDAHGNGVHLGERDCSLQRRHQKIVEEAPSPVVDSELREVLGTAALAVARAAGYESAGTAEFLLRDDGSWCFLEMNARLQVEHPVTEAITGLDLVRAQLGIASGEPLGLGQDDVRSRGHAIEARVYAEDPAVGFLPTGGRVERLALPQWPGVRIDSALREGDVVGLGYDPLLAKVVVVAEDRAACLARLRAALAEVLIVGIPTNLGFLLEVLHHPDVVEGRAGTDWVTSVWTTQVPQLPEGTRPAGDLLDPWTAFGAPRSEPEVVVAGAWAQYRGWAYPVAEDEQAPVVVPPHDGSLTAPIPAEVARVEVQVGDIVSAGQVVVMLEAMKMQMRITVSAPGTVRAVHVRPGDVVVRGQILIEVDPS